MRALLGQNIFTQIRKVFGVVGGLLLSGLFVTGLFAYTIPVEFPYDQDNQTGEEAVDFGEIVRDDAVSPTDGVSEQIQQAFRIDLDSDQRATAYIKEIINWMLAIVGLIALTMLIYAFYKLFFTESDEEGLKSARKIALIAIIALFIIGLAWIIVSQFFDLFFQVKEEIDA